MHLLLTGRRTVAGALRGVDWSVLVFCSALAMGHAHAQESGAKPAVPSEAFDVSSVKISAPGYRGTDINWSPGRIRYTNTGLVTVLCDAFNIKHYQIKGPEWLSGGDSFTGHSNKYVIEATFRPQATKEQVRIMLQRLLSDRFNMTSHWETKEVRGYDLVVDEKGSKLRKGSEPPENWSSFTGPGAISGPKSVDDLAVDLTDALSRPVVNQTKVDGVFYFKLRWAVDDAPADTIGPSLFTAVREQLGLKLVPAGVQLNVLVIDRLDRVPTPN